MNVWIREYFGVWRVSVRAVALIVAVVFTFWSVAHAVLSFLAWSFVPPLLFWGYTLAHRKAYEKVHAAEALRLPVRRWWWNVSLGSMTWGALMAVSGVILALPAVALGGLLLPYVYFMMVEGLGPIEALKENLRLAMRHPIAAIALGALIFGASTLMWFGSRFLTLYVAGSTMFVDNVAVKAGWGLGLYGVKLMMMIFGMSLQVAGAITIYRAVRGKVAGISAPAAMQEQGSVSAVPVPAAAAPPGEW
ncbi:hypothetical protein EA187_06085 [Lujinxingia sediminis]|uniref:DUF4013 domain-containing protein n=1 Tax=Lujinxingia sediminis TaxID=2480984 RepID=A0ABY0CVL7_9DELT|nr:hypothetical protein [Lujinxingia sediminis]RVU46704.1 hypothetical protein EA187_06085 [Lujinxingia sediminis]